MELTLPGKWVDDVSASDGTRDVALRSLTCRLETVLRLLPLSAEASENHVETIHQLRVWSRRANAALRMYEDLLPRKRLLRVKKQLRRIRRVAGAVRDRDVLIEELLKKPEGPGTRRWLKELRAGRAKAQKKVVRLHKRLQKNDRFATRVASLLEALGSQYEDSTDNRETYFGDWARQSLQPVVEQFLAAIPDNEADSGALHRFRICSKKLRYAMELLVAVFPDEFRTTLYPTIETIQDQLGEINNLAMMKAEIQKKLEQASEAKAAAWQDILARMETRVSDAHREFWSWCTPQRLQELRCGFEAMRKA